MVESGYNQLNRLTVQSISHSERKAPIHMAVERGSLDLLQALHQKGVSIESELEGGSTPMSFFFRAQTLPSFSSPYFRSNPCLPYLLNNLPKEALWKGVQIYDGMKLSLLDALCQNGIASAALCVAQLRGSIGGDHQLLHYLIADPEITIARLQNAIDLGADVNFLCALGVSLRGLECISPLHRLVLSNRTDKNEIAEFLMRNGADMNLPSHKVHPMFEKMAIVPSGKRSALEEAALRDPSLAKKMMELGETALIAPTARNRLLGTGDFINGVYQDPAYALMELQGASIQASFVKYCRIDKGIDRKKIEEAIRLIEASHDPLTKLLLNIVSELGDVSIYICQALKDESRPVEKGLKGFFQSFERDKIVVLDDEDPLFIAQAIIHELGHLVDHRLQLSKVASKDLQQAYIEYCKIKDEPFGGFNDMMLDLTIQNIFASIQEDYKEEEAVSEIIARTFQSSFVIHQKNPASNTRLRIRDFEAILEKELRIRV